MPSTSPTCVGPVTRREFLSFGAAALGGLTLPQILQLRQANAQAAVHGSVPETSVIFIWLPGGPPHMEMYDLKPNAPSDYRGEYAPIDTKVPGMQIGHLLPLHAKLADKFTLIRSIAHDFADHGGGHKRFLTGRDPKEPTGFVNDYPAVGSVVAKMREHVSRGLPNYVSGTDPGRDQVDVFSFGAAYLGPSYAPFSISGDPSTPTFKVPNMDPLPEIVGQLDDRRQLLSGLDRVRFALDGGGLMHSMDRFQTQAIDLITGPTARNAFDLSQEPAALRERYGMHAWGQRALLARRLVEAGSSFVTMVMENPYQSGIPYLKEGVYNWDSHGVNCHMYHDLAVRLPIYDQAVTALIEDVYARGLDKKVLVVVTGEFGRTPRLNPQTGSATGVMQPGRDHWPQSMSLMVFGGGMRTGQVVGATNSKGEYPTERPLTPNDLWATVYRHLGIDYEHAFLDHNGRPMPILPYGEPIAELI